MEYQAGDIISSTGFLWILESPSHDSGRWTAFRQQRTREGWSGEALMRVEIFPDLMLKNTGYRLQPRLSWRMQGRVMP